MPTLAALAYHKHCGTTPTQPNAQLGFVENLLYMLDASGSLSYRPDPRLVHSLEVLLVLHAEHGMSCSAAAVRHLASRWELCCEVRWESEWPCTPEGNLLVPAAF